MIILGLNAFHGDSSACLVVDGKLVAAAEEERFRRIKHWAGFPSEAVKYCLAEAGIGICDVDQVAINQDAQAHLWKKLVFLVARRPDLSFVIDRLRNKKERTGILEELSKIFPGNDCRASVVPIEHHRAHMASAHLVSPYKDSVVVSVDGFGDFASAAWGVGRGTAIDVEGRVYFPHSLGIFYQALTQYLGFPNYGDEYKVMGLAPYGEPRYLDKMRRIVSLCEDGAFRLDLAFFRHHAAKVEYEWDGGEPTVGNLYSTALVDLLGPARQSGEELSQHHRDLARSVQAMYEEAFFHLLNTLYVRHRLDDLTIAGGCAMNSVANGRVYRNTPFKRLYVQSAAGDAGGAIGAAYAAWVRSGGTDRFHMAHAYWGPHYSTSAMADLLAARADELDNADCSVRRIDDESQLARETAQAIADGRVIGWFQGRMEWGPRALGNRSILADPRRADMKDILNLKIKRRESFRPFAPSILREHVSEWFETEDDVPFMMQVYPIREAQRSRIPAVTHHDGSGRLQTVERKTNRRYWVLIDAFRELTGVPIVLNTSFNENEPVVCRPEEALDCFLRTKMDVLVLGNFYVERHTAE
jgi:carbamoyltransferase